MNLFRRSLGPALVALADPTRALLGAFLFILVGPLHAAGDLGPSEFFLGGGTYGAISQIGDHNDARLEQQGSRQYGLINQIGSDNKITATQSGAFNWLDATQIGYGNSSNLNQSGSDNTLNLFQSGNNNMANVTQIGGNVGTVTQIGSNNTANVIQNHLDYKIINLEQRGSNLTTTLIQY